MVWMTMFSRSDPLHCLNCGLVYAWSDKDERKVSYSSLNRILLRLEHGMNRFGLEPKEGRGHGTEREGH